jgi:hypothetical protein
MRRSVRRFVKWVGGAVFLALASWGAVLLAQHVAAAVSPPPPPLPEQLTRLVRGAARSGWRITQAYHADLRGNGQDSTIFVLRSLHLSPPGLQSDQLRVYDLRGGRLRQTFRFQPAAGGSVARLPFEIDLDTVKDLDGNGTADVVATVGQIYADAVVPFPVLLYWDPVSNRYRLSPLLRPVNGRPALGPATDPDARRDYEHVFIIRDTWSGGRFTSYHVEDFFVKRGGFSPILVAGFLVKSSARADPNGVYQLNAWNLDLGLAQPGAYHCIGGLGDLPLLFRLRPRESLREGLTREWQQVQDRC